jgi:CheY-like chemotaxis protein
MPHAMSVIRAIQNYASGIVRPSNDDVAEADWTAPVEAQPVPPPPTVFGTVRSYAACLKHLPAPRVLVVDDETGVRMFVERVLRDAGYVVVTANGGPEALQAIQDSAEFDLIVSDVRMPAMSGPEFITRVRQDRPGISVLFLTGYNDQLFKERTALNENEAFLDKPASVKGLLEAVSLQVCGHLMPAHRFD